MALKKKERQAKILEIITNQVIESQEELMYKLQAEGIDVTQATVSRDINELRIVRHTGANGVSHYQLLEEAPKVESTQIDQGFQEMALSMTRVEFLTIIKTTAGNGNRLAALIDDANLVTVIATLAGHDTIYVTSPDNAAAQQFMAQFAAMIG